MIGNQYGFFTFITLILLLLLYFVRPKPFKKIIPSIIFLESAKKRVGLTSFFSKFIKDWLLLLQFLTILLLCIATLDITATLVSQQLKDEVVLVIDTSASSSSNYQGRTLLDHFKKEARANVGISTSIVLVKNSPEVIAQQTNPVNAHRAIASIQPTESLSSIWDSMMLASSISSPNAEIIVFSDLIDTNEKNLETAKKILEAKGHKVSLYSPIKEARRNVGIIDYLILGQEVTVDIKNFGDQQERIKIRDKEFDISPGQVEQVAVDIANGINTIEIEINDDLKTDNKLTLIKNSQSDNSILYISNHDSYVSSALESMDIQVHSAEPPIVSVKDENIIVLDQVDYNSLLPGTIDSIEKRVREGASLIITATENYEKIDSLLPVRTDEIMVESAEVLNMGAEGFEDYRFGLSSKYYSTELVENTSLVIAETSNGNPIIVKSNYGKGNIFYYGIFDEENSFKITTDYPLFWINTINFLATGTSQPNLRMGHVLYGQSIRGPDQRYEGYVIPEKTGIYHVDDTRVSINLLNDRESDINIGGQGSISETEGKKSEQQVNLLPVFVAVASLLILLELYLIKKRGDI